MRDVVLSLAGNIVSLACVIAALTMAVKGVKGWGWFLLIAALTFTTFHKS